MTLKIFPLKFLMILIKLLVIKIFNREVSRQITIKDKSGKNVSSSLMLVYLHVKQYLSVCLSCEAALNRDKELCT